MQCIIYDVIICDVSYCRHDTQHSLCYFINHWEFFSELPSYFLELFDGQYALIFKEKSILHPRFLS